MADISITRRGCLGAMAVLPIMGMMSSAAHAVPTLTCWDNVRIAYETADKAMNDYDKDYHTPAVERYIAWRDQWPITPSAQDKAEMARSSTAALAQYEPVEARFDQLLSNRSAALEAMLAHPAPDAKAVAYKVEILISEERWHCDNFEHVMARILADLRRAGVN